MDNLNNNNVELLQPTVQVDSIPIEEKPIEELTTDEIKAIIIAKDNALNNYKATLDRMTEAHAKDIENLNEYYSKKIKEMNSLIQYYERKFKVLESILTIERGE